jgi:ferritin-like metal-binding protein YciE
MSTITEHDSKGTLRMYVNDMIALEKDLANAVNGQLEDDRVMRAPNVSAVIGEIATASESRLKRLELLSEALHGQFGAAVKEAVASVTGVMAGIYGKLRKHPVSRMLRDDQTVLNLAATSYGMLYTSALAMGNDEVAELALAHLDTLPPQIMELSEVIPDVVARELKDDGEIVDLSVINLAIEAIEQSWASAARE